MYCMKKIKSSTNIKQCPISFDGSDTISLNVFSFMIKQQNKNLQFLICMLHMNRLYFTTIMANDDDGHHCHNNINAIQIEMMMMMMFMT